MNRKIEFRGKRLDNNEWVYGYLYIQEPPLTVCDPQDENKRRYFIIKTGFADWNMDRPMLWHEVNPDTTGQFVNQFDKNNIKIFEDDWVKHPNGWSGDYMMSSANKLVWWEEYSSSFIIDKPDDVECSECEVVGNKFDGVKEC